MASTEAEDKEAQKWKAFGLRVRQRRKQLKKSQTQCGAIAGIERQRWFQIEQGGSTKDSTIRGIAAALELPEDEVLAWAGRNYGNPVTIAGGSITVAQLLSYFSELPAEHQDDAMAIIQTLWARHRVSPSSEPKEAA